MNDVIWTIGTSTRSMEEFVKLLKKYEIEVLVDVRRFPTSRFDHFKKESLERYMKGENIAYVHIEKLGGYRRGGYEKYMESKEFKEGLEKLLKLARGKKIAIMCAELLFFRCHRRYISDRLVELGKRVIHIIDERKVYEHRIKTARS
ncbi:MAG: DUF488 domain-containing protein [Candidatus Syntropharchaeia archaeon]